MNYESLVLLCKSQNLVIPPVIKVEMYAHTSAAGKKGSTALIKKYGRIPIIETVRKEAWKKWWVDDGSKRKLKILQRQTVLLPSESVLLAEYMGIVLGDGGITKYRVVVTLNSVDDLEYSQYVAKLTRGLFGVEPKIYFRKEMKVVDIVVARIQLVLHLTQLGLVIGNKVKRQVSIPEWIKQNSEYSLACVRGLFDTDGCFFTHSYVSGGRTYSYKKITFSSASPVLRKAVLEILHRVGINAHCSGTNVRIDAVDDVAKYLKLIGTKNLKHLKRYSK